MNCVSIKKSYLALVACGLLSAQTVLTCIAGDMQFQKDELSYVHQLAGEIEQMFEFFRDNISKFVDSTDHTPYRKLVMDMSDKLDQFQTQVVVTLNAKLADAGITNNTEAFNQSLSIVQDVLTEFTTKVNVLRSILVKPEYLKARDGIQAIKLGKELEKYCKDLLDGNMIMDLVAKIDKILALISRSGDQGLNDRLTQIKSILKKLKGTSLQKRAGSELKIVSGITAKIRHNR